jgi:hypothetical protein
MKTSITLVENTEFPASPGTADEEVARVAKLRKFRKRERKLLGRVRRKDAGSDLKAQRNMVREWQGSAAYRICGAVRANKKLPLARRGSLAELFEMGNRASWNAISDEKVHIHIQPKSGSKFRTVSDFENRNRMMHYAAVGAVFPNLNPKPFQYEFKGKGEFGGISAAIQDIKASILAGNRWAARLDIKAFYESFTEEQLCKLLPLLKNVVRQFATGNYMNAVREDGPYNAYYNLDDVIDQARRGITQGSALSPKIGSAIIAQLAWDAQTFLANWVDDFLILGSSEEEVRDAANTLIAKVAALPGGHFSLILKDVRHASDRIVFLGHAITLLGSEVEIEPAFFVDFYGPLEKMEKRLGPMIYMLSEPNSQAQKVEALEIIGDMWVFARSWADAFKACDHMHEDLAAVECDVRNHAYAAGVSWEDICSYQNSDARWKRRYS